MVGSSSEISIVSPSPVAVAASFLVGRTFIGAAAAAAEPMAGMNPGASRNGASHGRGNGHGDGGRGGGDGGRGRGCGSGDGDGDGDGPDRDENPPLLQAGVPNRPIIQ